MTTQRADGASATARRAGYLIGFVVNGILLYLVNERPGWREVPFLTERMTDVLPLINLSLLVGAAANLLYVVQDAAWVRSLGQIVVAAVGIALVNTLASVAGISPAVVGAIKTRTGSLDDAIYLLCALFVIAALAMALGMRKALATPQQPA